MSMKFADAAEAVLEAAGEPLHCKEITKRIIEQGLVQSKGKTPTNTLSTIFLKDIKRGESSRFVRVRPNVFGLRTWGIDSSHSSLKPTQSPDDEQRVRISKFPLYSEIRLVLPVWNGCLLSQITRLLSTITELSRSPQDPVDWTDPDNWILNRLQGDDYELAEAIWLETDGKVNPRYIYGHWSTACTYQLVKENTDGRIILTERGQDFLADEHGDAVALIDQWEGLLKILTIVAEKGTGRREDFLFEWREYLQRYSRFGTDSTIKNTLERRLLNLLDRGLLTKTGTTYSITDVGLAYLNSTEGDEDVDNSDEQQQLLMLVKQHQVNIRFSIQVLLDEMNPFAFEHLVKQLLEAMNYQNVRVTSPSNDKGVDVVADIEVGITSVREVVQAKRHKARIQRKDLDALRGSLHRFNAFRGTIITTGDFSKGTREAAFEPGVAPITLINGEKLIDLLIEHKIGIRKKSIEILELDADAFAQFDEIVAAEAFSED